MDDADKLGAGDRGLEQLKKYAKDLVEVYGSEKEKREKLEAANQQIIKYADDLSKTISDLKAANRELQEAYLDTINRLVVAAEYRDEDTGAHIMRMSRYSALLAEKLGLPAMEVQNTLYAVPMHDVGKIGIPDGILLKKGRLTEEEFQVMTTHTTIGANILADSSAEILQLARQIALCHHEKWNGKGYPEGLSRQKIPLVGRIVALADTFDALTSKRPYKDPYPIEVACDIIKKECGQHFDPDVVEIFINNLDEMLKIKAEVGLAADVELSGFTWSERDQLEGTAKNR
ncbi:HD-GYP domain-containing protein [Gemmatimonadota bacterium]